MPKLKGSLEVGAINGMNTKVHYYTKITIKSICSKFEKSLNFYIIPEINEQVPGQPIPRETFNIPSNIKLADPNFHIPAPVDLLIGSGPTLSTFCVGQINLSPSHDLILQKTKFGWIVGGGNSVPEFENYSKCFLTNLKIDLEKFWDIEEISSKKFLSTEETFCEDHFQKHVSRDVNGRYVVALPFNENIKNLGESNKLH